MAGSGCRNSMSVCAVRASRLAADGTFATGATGAIAVCGGVGKVDWTPQIQTGDDITELDGCGNIAVSRKYPDRRKRFDVSLDFITTSFELMELLSGATLLTDGGNTVGYAEMVQVSCGTAFTEHRVCLEVWGEQVECDGSSLADPYSVHVFPDCVLTSDVRTLQRGVNHLVLKGPVKPNANFGSGPFGDLTPLSALTGWDHAELSAAALPTCDADCNYVTLPSLT